LIDRKSFELSQPASAGFHIWNLTNQIGVQIMGYFPKQMAARQNMIDPAINGAESVH